MAVEATPLQASPAYVAAPGRLSQLVRELPIVPGAILALLVLTAIFAPVLAPYDPTIPVPGAKISMPPMWMEGGNPNVILGTDRQGRDLLSRLIYGARVTLVVAVTEPSWSAPWTGTNSTGWLYCCSSGRSASAVIS